jgi:hypothetical protein
MTIKISDLILDSYDDNLALPERYLWLAVVERALKDYCFFFDRLTGADQGNRVMQNYLNFRTKTYSFNYKKAVAEYSRLNWFMFDLTPIPFNLEYICIQLYDDGSGVAARFRTEAKKLLNKHIIDSKAEERFGILVDHIKGYANEPYVDSDPRDKNSFRTKRYRLSNADS